MMWRMRRSRIILLLAVFTLFLLYHFKSIPDQWSVSNGKFHNPVPAPERGGTEERVQADGKGGALAEQVKAERPQQATTTVAVAYEEYKTKAGTAKTMAKAVAEGLGLVFDTNTPPAIPQATHNTPQGPADEKFASEKFVDTRPAKQPAAPAQTVIGTAAGGPDVFGLRPTTTTSQTIHWTKLPEHFPIPLESIIPLPTEKAKPIPRIQHVFKDETAAEKSKREDRQKRIKKVFQKSWDGYAKYAWLHDEIRPVSGHYKDPFCGWAATLVDSLDSLYIMGFEEEFNDALEGLASIDFTTTSKREIPLFETTIRYLGGLLSAYDLSKREILLTKAVELAEVLMGAFDTPNRMPQTFYQWMPVFMQQPKRAKTREVMAELGSLSMEFTRLAQITKENKYYDAIARITNEFDVWQDNTKIPGLWPLYIDASGCKKPNIVRDGNWEQKLMNNHKHDHVEEALTTIVAKPQAAQRPTPVPKAGKPGKPEAGKVGTIKNFGEDTEGPDEKPAGKNAKEPAPPAVVNAKPQPAKKGKIANWDGKEENLPEGNVGVHQMSSAILKRQLDRVPQGVPHHDHGDNFVPLGPDMSVRASPMESKVDCVTQGLASPPGITREEFSFGGMADSTYEYLPKQFLLLGGQVPQYQKMYEKAIAAANKYLLLRTMNPQEVDIVLLGKGDVYSYDETEKVDLDNKENFAVSPILSHLLCFTGGMYGMGSKIFNRPEDLEIAKKMTEACVWAYGITTTGIMPEDMMLVPCADQKSCPWNQTAWEYEIDPFPDIRIEDNLELQRPSRMADDEGEEDEDGETTAAATPTAARAPTKSKKASAVRRQLGGIENDRRPESKPKAGQGESAGRPSNRMDYLNQKSAQDGFGVASDAAAAATAPDSTPDDEPMTQKEYVEFMMAFRHVPKGVKEIMSKKYILRPEAIESVFYMYRLTGDPVWREKGWRMFEAIERATDAEYGASAILDVMDEPAETHKSDSMESFWLAETLKYFYLLFAPEDLISLDDWVLNTEAHPFKRPQ